MKLWRDSEADVRDAITKDIQKNVEASLFINVADDEFALRSWLRKQIEERRSGKMQRPLPHTPAQWFKEIKLAIADACETKPFGRAIGTPE